jgi:hypothetical protein
MNQKVDFIPVQNVVINGEKIKKLLKISMVKYTEPIRPNLYIFRVLYNIS